MYRSLLIAALTVPLLACKPDNPEAEVSQSLAQQLIVPTYQHWLSADENLVASAQAYCQGRIELPQARADFQRAQQLWGELQPLLIGPLAEGNRSWQVQFWPDKKDLVGRQVEQLLNSGTPITPASLSKASVVLQGLTAYEYILYDRRLEVSQEAVRSRYCPLLQAIAAHQQTLAKELLQTWQQEAVQRFSSFPNAHYAEAQEAIAELLRVQVATLEVLKKKLGMPLGRQSRGIVQPLQAEWWRSGAALSSLNASLSSAEKLWRGVDGKGLRSLLAEGQQDLATRIDAAYADSLGKLAQLKDLQSLLESPQGQQQLNALYDSLSQLGRLYGSDLAKALGVQLGFNAHDGD